MSFSARTQITFQTEVPAGAPETKGYTCYFQPGEISWYIGDNGFVSVMVSGPSTRAKNRRGEMTYTLSSSFGAKRYSIPSWIPIPTDVIDRTVRATEEIQQMIKEME